MQRVIHIVGGGIAGLTLAEALGKRKIPWRLYEKAAALGAEASGKNAGIVRTYEADAALARLALKTLQYYRAHEPSFNECGLLLKPWEIDYSRSATAENRTFIHNGETAQFFPDNGTVEPLDVLARIGRGLKGSGEIRFNAALAIRPEGDRISGLKFSNAAPEENLNANDKVVVCAGEGSVPLADALPLAWRHGLIAHKRTLYSFTDSAGLFKNSPVEWDEHSGVYFRPTAEGIVATAGEQIPAEGAVAGENADDDAAKAEALAIFRRELHFITREQLLSTRKCRRLMPLDNRPYCGADPAFTNLYWFTGLGGRGMSIGPALAEELAELLVGGKNDFLEAHFSPSRALTPTPLVYGERGAKD